MKDNKESKGVVNLKDLNGLEVMLRIGKFFILELKERYRLVKKVNLKNLKILHIIMKEN